MFECRVYNMKVRPQDPSCGPGNRTSCALLENFHIYHMMKNPDGRAGYVITQIWNSELDKTSAPRAELCQHIPDASPGTRVWVGSRCLCPRPINWFLIHRMHRTRYTNIPMINIYQTNKLFTRTKLRVCLVDKWIRVWRVDPSLQLE
jgi:hypothetical protein